MMFSNGLNMSLNGRLWAGDPQYMPKETPIVAMRCQRGTMQGHECHRCGTVPGPSANYWRDYERVR